MYLIGTKRVVVKAKSLALFQYYLSQELFVLFQLNVGENLDRTRPGSTKTTGAGAEAGVIYFRKPGPGPKLGSLFFNIPVPGPGRDHSKYRAGAEPGLI